MNLPCNIYLGPQGIIEMVRFFCLIDPRVLVSPLFGFQGIAKKR